MIIQTPANEKLRLIILSAGIPILSISSDALNSAKSLSGITWNSVKPISISATAYIIENLIVSIRRFLLRAP